VVGSILFDRVVYDDEIKKRSFFLLKKVLKKLPKLEKMIGIDLFYYINSDKVDWEIIYAKLVAINDQIEIIEG